MKVVIFIYIILGGLCLKAQDYRFILDSVPTICAIDTIDIEYLNSIDTSIMTVMSPGVRKNYYSNGDLIKDNKNQSQHYLGKFFKGGFCWLIEVADIFDNGANQTRILNLTIYDKSGKIIGGQPIAQYIDMGHSFLINECYFFELGFKVADRSKSNRFKLNLKRDKVFYIENGKLTERE